GLDMLQPEHEARRLRAGEAQALLEEAEMEMHGWQEQWDAFNQLGADPRRAAEVQQARMHQLEQSLERLAERERRLREEHTQLASDPQDAAILEVSELLAASELQLEELQLEEMGHQERLEALRAEVQQSAETQQRAQGEQ